MEELMRRCAPAEAARSMVAAGASLAVQVDGADPVAFVGAYSSDAAGRLLLPVAARSPLVVAAERYGDVAVQGSVSDVAPLPLRRRVRGRLSFAGWAEPLEAGVAELLWRKWACACSPLGQEHRLVRVDLAEVVLERDEQPATEVDLDAYAAARPDPLAAVEAELLQHLAQGHPEALAGLVAQLPHRLRRGAPRVVPWRLDRYQLVLRVERPTGDVDVAFGLPDPAATCAREVIEGLRQVVDGCGHQTTKRTRR